MPMAPSHQTNSRRALALATLACLAVLFLLFHRSFSEGNVLFANDAPLGQLKPQEGKGLSNFSGVWMELNWIGSTQPSALPNVSNVLYLLLGAVGFSKFYAPIALLLLGCSAALFFRQLGLGRMAVILGGLAAWLNTDPFSYACWGLPSLTLTMAAIFLALAALVTPWGRHPWMKAALAGLAVGFSICEGYDNGAIFSLYIAAFAFFQIWIQPGKPGQRALTGVIRVAIVAGFAALMAAQALSTLIGTQIKGIDGTQQDSQTKEMRWDAATMGSLPKLETLRVVIPGLFGYRMDTANGGYYWGAVGQTPGVPASRHSGAGVYAGVLVVFLALWAVARSCVSSGNPFSEVERRHIWFWAGAALVSLLLAFGRHAPFYQLLYALPYFSTIRMPYKFMHPFSLCIVTLFAFGLEGLGRLYLERATGPAGGIAETVQRWWRDVRGFDRRWTQLMLGVLATALLGWLMFASSHAELTAYLQKAGFPGEIPADILRFSLREIGWTVLFGILALLTWILIASGTFNARRIRWAVGLLTVVLLTDLIRANAPWIVYENYQQKYASNPVVELLRQRPHLHRVAGRLSPMAQAFLAQGEFTNIYSYQWMQHLFPYFGIQCLDIIQMPRMPELEKNYLQAFSPRSQTNLFPLARLWQLTNTRWLLGMNPYLELLNQQVDPVQRGFRIYTNFDFAPRSTAIAGRALSADDLTTALAPKGPYAVFEVTPALPRAMLFDHWIAPVDDDTCLTRLTDPAFDPLRTVLLSDPLADQPSGPAGSPSPGSAEITRYEAKRVDIKTQSPAATVLLLNDRHHPDWKVTVDGQSAPLLRANYIMRGVRVPAGEHTVEFRFEPSFAMLFVSLLALALAGVLWTRLALERPRTTQT
jgi:Bacterial membrane protein YfhO